ncbi:hypothetical protein BASA81_010247 [Batrachochytrium salamandrivorans]|nr:hypothetical protein BASA81_010247 [Batrachochytrium salamandrivorans]
MSSSPLLAKSQKYSCVLTAQLLCCYVSAFLTLTFGVVLVIWFAHHRHNLAVYQASEGLVPSCPGSPVPLHSTCSWKFTIPDHNCREVQEEVERRLQGLDGWKDPRHGKYKLTESVTKGNRSTQAYHLVQEPYQYEKFVVKYSGLEKGNKTCEVSACSQSQDKGLYDGSANYCNVRNLVCGKSKGCKTSRHNLELVEHVKYTNCLFHFDGQCKVDKK